MARYVDDEFDLFGRQVVENVRFLALPDFVKCGRFYSPLRELLRGVPGCVNSVPVFCQHSCVWDYSFTSLAHTDEYCIALSRNVEVASDKCVDKSILECVSETCNLAS